MHCVQERHFDYKGQSPRLFKRPEIDMRLTPDQRATLYSHISAILQEHKANLTSTDGVSDALSIAHDACADFAASWNFAQSAVHIFPLEVLGVIFRLLSFPTRVSASQVCRTWRKVSLDDPSLWRDIVVAKRTPSQINAVASRRCFELLRRSNPAPFHMAFDAEELVDGSVELDDAVVALIKQNLYRLACYRGPQVLALDSLEILEAALPELHSLSLLRPDRVLQIPSHWSGERAPPLRRLELGACHFTPGCQPFRVLEHFSGSLSGPDAAAAAARLFWLFPCLESLELRIKQDIPLPSPPFPPSLRNVSIRAVGAPLEPAYLTQWFGAPLLHLTLGKVKRAEPLVRWFVSLNSGAWSMFFSSSTLVLSSPTGLEYTAELDDCYGVCKGLAPHILGVQRLVLEGYCLGDLCGKGILLPNLRSLQIVVREYLDAASWASLSPAGSFFAPALRRLDLAWLPRDDHREDETVIPLLAKYFPRNFRSWVHYDARVLRQVTLTLSVVPPEEPVNDFGELAALADDFVLIQRYDLGYDPVEYAQLQDFPADPLVLF
ncbi:hypothetical protein AURDEDRAFT_167631 [Auricularia subglabra TFB-10046 SS5]|nr:hypothetical protein AURDEDRAFT_167631 [Auricularia subglabra TFB-10046 SS5]